MHHIYIYNCICDECNVQNYKLTEHFLHLIWNEMLKKDMSV